MKPTALIVCTTAKGTRSIGVEVDVVYWVAFGFKKQAEPFQVGRKSSHHATSARAWQPRRTRWCRLLTVVLREMSRRKKSRPAGMASAAKERLPMRDSREHFVDLVRVAHSRSSVRISLSLLGGSQIYCRVESISRPRKVRVVAGPSTLSIATGIPRRLQTCRSCRRCSVQVGESGGPATK